MIEKNYYSLRFLGTNAYHTKGYILKTTNKVLNIGESPDCEIRYETGQYEPELYASIIANEDERSWRLVQRSPYVKAQIAGFGEIGYVQQLNDGDVICFEDQCMELEFHVHHDSNYGNTGVVIEHHSNKRMLYSFAAIVAAIMILFLGITYHFFINEKQSIIRYEQLHDYLTSVYIIRVDSVQWIETSSGDTTFVRPTMILDTGGAVGTAFLTTSGKLLTARHCIEYWIGDDIDLRTKVSGMSDNDIRKWAILCEKYMQERENKDSSQQLRVFFSIYDYHMPDEPVYCFSSTDSCVHVNRSHDGILEFADFSENYYWRTIRPYFSNWEMELGDIVYIDVDQKGKIELADSAMIAQLNQSSVIAVLGFPNKSSGKEVTYEAGRVIENRFDTVKVNLDIQFEANITHGFSGGPIFICHDKKIYAAGVVSKIDTDNGIYKKAVPVTEIINMSNRKEAER